jgi:hypothetical protein
VSVKSSEDFDRRKERIMARDVRTPCRLSLVLLALSALVAGSVNPDCPSQPGGCQGTAISRADAARERARALDLNGPWSEVREAVVEACGLRVQRSTSHCFNDFNHVDCCAMASEATHSTNEQSKVRGMHSVNFLGSHIVDASIPDRGEGGSWCTCHISSPEDVCHKQFGARTAFKLVWCGGTGVAALLDDYANVLASGKPVGVRGDGSDIPTYGGERARQDSWQVLDGSHNATWAHGWRQACKRVAAGDADDEQGRGYREIPAAHDEL